MLFLAFVYENIWKIGEQPTWPAKGWFQLSRGDCSDFAVNGLFGVMSVMYEKNGTLQAYYSGNEIGLEDVVLYNGQSKQISPEYLCLGAAPFSGYEDHYPDYYNCSEGQEKIPFQIVFDANGNEHFTLTLR